jgi:hypothetical protein
MGSPQRAEIAAAVSVLPRHFLESCHPKASRLFCQVLGAVGQQMPATDSVISAGASELRHGETVQSQLLKFSVCFHLCVPDRRYDHSFVSDPKMDSLQGMLWKSPLYKIEVLPKTSYGWFEFKSSLA